MMKTAGIIAEYNPFHNGHRHHLNEVRELSGCDFITVVMSGNYVQRGAPTIADKYARCKMALLSGADLVLELPTCFATASAEYFAFGGVEILDKLNVVDFLCFGTESMDNHSESKDDLVKIFSEIADLMIDEPAGYGKIIKDLMKSGESNAAARAHAVKTILGDKHYNVMETSNNILGVEYMKALKRLNSSIKPLPTARSLTRHSDKRIMEGFASATAIRNAIFNQYNMNTLSGLVPDDALEVMQNAYLESFPIFRDDFSVILGGKLLKAKEPAQLAEYFGVSLDLASRMFNHRSEFKSFNQFRELIMAKNITKATAGRALMHIVLDIKKDDMKDIYNPEKLRAVKVLGFRKSAEPLLSEIKKKADINLVTKLADYVPDSKGCDVIEQTTGVDMLYRMIAMNKFGSDLLTPWEEEIVII